MKIITRRGIIRTELFKEIMLHEKACSIAFCYAYRYEEDGDEATEFQIQVPITFSSYREARKAFRKYLRARNSGEESVSFLEFRCPWPKRTYRKIISHKNESLLFL